MVFHNPNRRVLEGELEFPLTPGQEISGLALDINGELRQGVPVGKARGQEVFDEVARRRVDPALLEATRGNAYRLRVYPLPAGGQRRVVVRVMQPLTADNGLWNYRLPLAMAEMIDTVSIEAVVAAPEGRVTAEAGNLGLRLEKAGAVFRGRAEARNISPEGWLDISLPAPESLPDSVTAARWQDKMYFSAAAQVAGPEDITRGLPNRMTLLWDASGSGRERDLAKEFALLENYFQAFGSGEARLVVLRNQAEPPRTFPIKNGDWRDLKTALHGLIYDGATNLTDWSPAPDCREFLLFSDGLANYKGGSGAEGFPAMTPEQRLFAVNSAPKADYASLRGLAVRGAVIDLAHEPAELAAAKLLREGTRISVVNAALAGAGEVVLAPESAYLATAGGQGGLIRLAGWVKRGEAKKIPIHLVFPDATSKEITLALPAWDEVQEAAGEDAPLPARLWGRYAIAGLEADYRANKKAIARLGEQLGIVSRETSLIVLETAEDYARYDVTPPAALKARVEALRRNKTGSEGPAYLADERLWTMWREKVKWWETDFSAPPKPAKKEVDLEVADLRPEVAGAQPDAQPRAVHYEDEKVYSGQRMSLDVRNADIHEVIRMIGEVSGKSVVVSDAVAGKVTMKLNDVPWDQALDIVLSSRNLGLEEMGNVLTVYDLPTLTNIRAGRARLKAERDAPSPPRAVGGSSSAALD